MRASISVAVSRIIGVVGYFGVESVAMQRLRDIGGIDSGLSLIERVRAFMSSRLSPIDRMQLGLKLNQLAAGRIHSFLVDC